MADRTDHPCIGRMNATRIFGTVSLIKGFSNSLTKLTPFTKNNRETRDWFESRVYSKALCKAFFGVSANVVRKKIIYKCGSCICHLPVVVCRIWRLQLEHFGVWENGYFQTKYSFSKQKRSLQSFLSTSELNWTLGSWWVFPSFRLKK